MLSLGRCVHAHAGQCERGTSAEGMSSLTSFSISLSSCIFFLQIFFAAVAGGLSSSRKKRPIQFQWSFEITVKGASGFCTTLSLDRSLPCP